MHMKETITLTYVSKGNLINQGLVIHTVHATMLFTVIWRSLAAYTYVMNKIWLKLVMHNQLYKLYNDNILMYRNKRRLCVSFILHCYIRHYAVSWQWSLNKA